MNKIVTRLMPYNMHLYKLITQILITLMSIDNCINKNK